MTDDQQSFLNRGIRESFRAYLGGLEDGQTVADSGAVVGADGIFAFPVTSSESNPAETLYETVGRVTLTGYAGLLKVVLESPRLRLAGGVAELSIPQGKREVTVGSGPFVAPGTPIRLTVTAAGSLWLGGQYPVGSELDPVVITATPLRGVDLRRARPRRPA